jgi:integrase/recombinase XerC
MRYLDTALGPHITAHLRWVKAGRRQTRTLNDKEYELARLAVNLPPGVGVADVGVEHLMLVMDVIPSASWRKVQSHWRVFFRWAIKFHHRAVQNPVDDLPELLPDNSTPIYKIFTETERELLIQAARFMDDPYRDRARALLMLDSGCRKAELRGLRAGDVDPVDRTITVTGKGDKRRVVAIRGPFWLAWEQALLEPLPRLDRQFHPDDFVWFGMQIAGAYKNRERQVIKSYPDRWMVDSAFHGWWGRLVGHAGIAYRKPHMTRHTYATDALDASPNQLWGVSQQLGHASTKTTEVYLHSSRKHKERVADTLARSRRRT